MRRLTGRIFVMKNSLSRAVEVFILARSDGPEKSDQPQKAKRDGGRNEIYQNVHRLLRKVRALRVTRMEDDDIATAATSGVTKPRTAKGTNRAL